MRYHVYDDDKRREYCYADAMPAKAHYDRLERARWGPKPCEVFGPCESRAQMPAGRLLPPLQTSLIGYKPDVIAVDEHG